MEEKEEGGRFIPIRITKARVNNVDLKYRESKLTYQAQVGLIDEYNKEVSNIYLGNGNYAEENNTETSLKTIDLANQLRTEIEVAIIRFMNSKQSVIEAPIGEPF